MAPRVGITQQAVLDAAAKIADGEGLDALSLTRLAAMLGIRTPSLYAHVHGLDDLRRRLALVGVDSLAAELRSATDGKTGRAALDAIADTYRSFALGHPGQYRATLRDPGDDHELRAANERALDVFLGVLRGFGIAESELMHCYRAFWAALHGFNALLATGVMSMPADLATSYERIVDIFMNYITPAHTDR
ncbi:MAG: TetR/AcrR family transcriptional regulator [Actinobacteria bacterium]|nr:MAG: TetR/AcrR family transcriptional regulator [Actinomycetota bacterium]